jgi:hypothetical protein
MIVDVKSKPNEYAAFENLLRKVTRPAAAAAVKAEIKNEKRKRTKSASARVSRAKD